MTLPNITPARGPLVPKPEVVKTFYAEIDTMLLEVTPKWFPCLQEGCCDGQAGCCRTALAACIPWTEAELLWKAIEKMPVTQRRSIAAEAKRQVTAAMAVDPAFFKSLDENGTYLGDSVRKLNEIMTALEHKPCPLLGIPGNDNDDPRPYACSVYADRPSICRTFGQCTVARPKVVDGSVALNEKGEMATEQFLLACDITAEVFEREMAKPENEEVALVSASNIDAIAKRLSAPAHGGVQVPMSMKPIPFWIVDLTDPTGDISNPDNIFAVVRAMINQAFSAAFEAAPGDRL